MVKFSKLILSCLTVLILSSSLQGQMAKLNVNGADSQQKITGYGGFVNSPTFQYNHMSTDEIRKMWGPSSEMGYNIMRIYIPSNKDLWQQVIPTAQLAKSLGLTLFASPWTPPAEWKTNGSGSGMSNGVEGFLKEENYGDFANYLNDFVVFLRNNNVELDYISVQNEPDYKVEYEGCSWTPEQMSKFLKNHASKISCKVMAPETVGLTNAFADAFQNPEVLPHFDVYAGHQYGGIHTSYKNFKNLGKKIWMTEFLINWNENKTPRDFDWKIDAFDFAKSINDAMLGNVDAWVHYATKRYYALMGDGTNGSIAGQITKRGYILSHYAKYATGYTRLGTNLENAAANVQSSAYIGPDGNKVTVMIINPSNSPLDIKVDLPFFTKSGSKILTTVNKNMEVSNLSFAEESFRPIVSVDASSITTLVFDKSKTREVSNMTGQNVNYRTIEKQVVTNPAFGNNYQLSGKTATLYNSTPLISGNDTDAKGYLSLDDRYNKLVFHVNSYSTSNLATSSNTTLYYVDDTGTVKSYNYGSITLPSSGSTNFDLVFDISRAVLTTGCKGIIGLRNGNYSSILTFTFGDVYFAIGDEKAMRFSGVYSDGDSNLMDAYENKSYTSLDFTNASNVNLSANWREKMANKNSIFYVNSNSTSRASASTNVVKGNNSDVLELSDQGGDFNVPFDFSATSASYTKTVNGYAVVVLPFAADIPNGIKVYSMQVSSSKILCTEISGATIPANTPVLISGNGTFNFTGSGNVSTPKAIKVDQFNAGYKTIKAYSGAYVLKTVNGVSGFYKITTGSEPVSSFSAYIGEGNSYSDSMLPLQFETLAVDNVSASKLQIYPNPAKNEIFIDWKSTDATYSIIDAKGSQVSLRNKLNNGKNRIDVSKLPSGLYFLEVSESGKSFKTKFIKQ